MKLRYTRRAARQLDAILAYIHHHSPQEANKVMDRIETALSLLLEQPSSGKLTGKRDLRRIVLNPYPYLIFYRATDDEIIVHGLRHAARKPRQ